MTASGVSEESETECKEEIDDAAAWRARERGSSGGYVWSTPRSTTSDPDDDATDLRDVYDGLRGGSGGAGRVSLRPPSSTTHSCRSISDDDDDDDGGGRERASKAEILL